jgi:hypothetical protein
MINEIKENTNKNPNKFQENTIAKLNEIKKTMQAHACNPRYSGS